MPKNITRYNLLISCPGDVRDEIEIIKRVVDNFNNQYTDILGISLSTKHGSKDSYAQSGNKPQKLLNEQFVHSCDAAIAIFWTRFGTETDEYGSGTEEEIEYMLDNGKQVFMYFSDKPVNPSNSDLSQYERVKEFREKYTDKGLYYEYSDDNQFEQLLTAHLAKYFLTLQAMEEVSGNLSVPKLKIKCASGKMLQDIIVVEPFIANTIISADELKENIRSKYSELISISLEKRVESGYVFSPNKPQVIAENRKERFDLAAEALEIELPMDFYELGQLEENVMASITVLGGRILNGTKEEKRKYHEFSELDKLIDDFMGWSPFERIFQNMNCLKLVLSNEGNMVDEDIDVTLKIPKNMIVTHKQLPRQEKDTLHNMDTYVGLDEVFAIVKTEFYDGYDSARRTKQEFVSSQHIANSFGMQKTNYEDEYVETLDAIFEYDYYEEGDFVKLKVHFDYLKHHNAVAFPTVIFVTNEIQDINYEITSKNSIEIQKGCLKVKGE